MSAEILFPVLGLLLVALGYPLARRRVRPNRWYGLRVPATFASERVWFEANAVAGRDLMVLGSAVGMAGLLLPLAGLRDNLVAVACTAVLAVGLLAVALRGLRLANRLYREQQSRPPRQS
jgi:uncharacterized membrane protein